MTPGGKVVDAVRSAVQAVVRDTPALAGDAALQRTIADRMLGVSLAAAELLAEDRRISGEIAARAETSAPPPLARAQAAADMRSGRAVEQAAGTLRATRDAIDFPGFVTNLITGVFQAIQTSNIQQLQAFSDLLEAVGSTTDDFSTSNIGRGRAAQWAVDRFGVFALESESEDLQLVLKDDAEMPDPEQLMRVLDATTEEVGTIDESELAETLIPLVQRKLGRDRQSMLATMVMMGLQRVVVDDGRLHASMQLQVDARSVAEQTQGEQFDSRVETEASANFGMGAWGASAKLSASVGYVKSDEQYSREDIAVQAGLRSSVDLRFRTLPLDVRQLADDRQLEQVQSRSLNPDAPAGLTSLISNNPERMTNAPERPTPAEPGSLIARDGGTQDEARHAFDSRNGEPAAADDRPAARERPATERPATERPATERPATERPATERPASERPATERPATERPATERPATERPATERPPTERPPAGEGGGGDEAGGRMGGVVPTSRSPELPAHARSLAALHGQWSTPGRPIAREPSYPAIPRS